MFKTKLAPLFLCALFSLSDGWCMEELTSIVAKNLHKNQNIRINLRVSDLSRNIQWLKGEIKKDADGCEVSRIVLAGRELANDTVLSTINFDRSKEKLLFLCKLASPRTAVHAPTATTSTTTSGAAAAAPRASAAASHHLENLRNLQSVYGHDQEFPNEAYRVLRTYLQGK